MKIAIVTDTHFGVRGDNLVFADYISRFFREVFIPYLDEHGIKHVIHCGDIVDRRKYINYLTARTLHTSLVKPLADRGINTTWIIGNHDIYFRESNQINSMYELYGDRNPKIRSIVADPKTFFNNMRIVDKPSTIDFFDLSKSTDGGGVEAELSIDCFPWINKENEEESLNLARNPKSKIALGHFEFAGFEMQKGQPMLSGMNHELFNKYLFVGSGHLHERSRQGNVQYFGCPYQLTWADYDCPRGFSVLDTDTLECEFIENPIKMFERIVYDDTNAVTLEQTKNEFNALKTVKGKIVKVVVFNKTQPEEFERFMSNIERQLPFTVKIVEDLIKVELNEVDVSPTEDTLQVLVKYANVAETGQRNQLVSLLTDLYNRALETQTTE